MDLAAFKYAVIGALQNLTVGWSIKAFIAAVLALLLHKHSVLFLAFSMLVVLDCVTKWIEISYKQLCSMGKEPTLIRAILGVPAARRQGKITSEVMKHRFLGKLFIYLSCVFSAGVVDLVMKQLNVEQWTVTLAVSYLVAIELLSIVENLSGAGCENLGGLATAIKKKLT